MAINIMCMKSNCKYYWEDSCTRNLKDERIIINTDGLCGSFKEGKSDWYKEGDMRLTKRVGNTVDFANGKANLTDHKSNVKMLFERLAEYEDLGMTPEEIKAFTKEVEEDE